MDKKELESTKKHLLELQEIGAALETYGFADVSKDGQRYGLSDLEFAYLDKIKEDYMEKIEELVKNDPNLNEDNILDIVKNYVKDNEVRKLKKAISPIYVDKKHLIFVVSKMVADSLKEKKHK